MRAFNGLLRKLLVVTLTVSLLSACGGKEERKAKYLERGQEYLADKNYEKARVEFKNALQIDPKDAQGHYFLGQVEERRKNWKKAFKAYTKASELDPDAIKPRVRLAMFNLVQATALKARKNDAGVANAYGLVQEQINEILKRDPGNAEGLALQANLWINDGENEKARDQLEKIVAEKPDLESAVVLLSNVYEQEGRIDEAESVLLKGVEVNPEPIVLQQRLVTLYLRHDQAQKAEVILRQFVTDNPDELSHRIDLASLLSQVGQLDKAEQVLAEAIAVDPEDARRYELYVEFLASRRGNDVASAKLEEFIAEKPDMTDLQMLLVKQYLLLGEKEKARSTLESIIASEGTDPVALRARVALAQMLAAEDVSDERALTLLNEVLEVNPRDNSALLLKGKLAANDGNYQEAINSFRSVLKDQPNNTELLQLLSAAHLGNDEKELAADTIRIGVENNPGDIGLRLSLARLLVNDGDMDRAMEQLDAILEIEEFNQQALSAKYELLGRKGDFDGMDEVVKLMQKGSPDKPDGFVQEARLRLAQQKYDEALAILDGLLQKDPENISALLAKVDVLSAQQKYDEAIAVARILQQAKPDKPAGYFIEGRLLRQKEDPENALLAYEKAYAREPESKDMLAALVDLEVSLGRADAAVQRLQALLAENPQHTSANDLLGLVWLNKKDYVAAEAAFERQLAITPANAATYGYLARARLGRDDIAGAVKAYERGQAVLENDLNLLIGLAGLKERQDDFEGAIAVYEKVLETYPGNAVSTNNLAALLSDHRSDEASLTRAVELAEKLEKTNQPAFLDTAGWVYYRSGDFARAAEILKRVVEQAPEVPVFRYHLGMTYFKQGDKQAAREHLTLATDGNYTYQGIDEARTTLKSL